MSYLVIEGFTVRVARGSRFDVERIGDTDPAWSGRGRSDTRGEHRTLDVVTSELETADALALRLLLQSPGPLSCSGDMIDGVTRDFERAGPVSVEPITADEAVVRFRLRESQDTREVTLLFSFDADAPGSYTFTRSGAIGAYVDEDGVLQNEATADTLRTSWANDDGGSGVDTRETPIEDAATNELTQSEDLTHADWTATGLSARTADQALGPENTLALDELVEDSGNSTHRVTQPAIGMTADASYAMSAWMMANSRDYGVLWLGDNGALGTNYVRAWFDLTDGTVSRSQEGGSGSLIRAYAQDWTWLVPGLYRCVVVGSVGSGVTTIGSIIAVSSDGTNLSYTGDGSSSIYAGYAQLEDQNSGAASSYIPTTTAAASRGAESLTADISFVPQDLTMYSEWRELGTSLGSSFPSVLRVGASDTDFLIALRRDNSSGDGRYEVAVQKDGAQLGVVEPNLTVSYGDVVRCAASVSYNAATDEITLTVEIEVVGGSSVTGASTFSGSYGPAFTSNQVEIGTDGFAGHRAHKVAEGVRTLAQMRSISSARLHRRVA